MKRIKSFFCFFLSFSLFLTVSSAQEASVGKILKEIFPLPSPTGYEYTLVSKIRELLLKTVATEGDNLGSLYMNLPGRREEGRVAILTGIDEIGYFVSGFHPEGYLMLDRAVPSPHPLFDSFQFGHPLIVWTKKGAVTGVMSLPSLHIYPRERRTELQKLFSLENALLDIGAQSKDEAKRKGIEILDPVTPVTAINHLAGKKMVGFSLGNKTCVSLLISLAIEAENADDSRNISLIWAAQTKFPQRGVRPKAALGAVRAKNKIKAEKILVVDIYPCEKQSQPPVFIGEGPVLVSPKELKSALQDEIEKTAAKIHIPLQHQMNGESPLMTPFVSADKDVIGLFLPVKFSSTPSEIVDFQDVESLTKLILALLQ